MTGAPGDQALERERLLQSRAYAALRLLLIVIVFVENRAVSHPLTGTLAFDLIAAVAGAYALGGLTVAWLHPDLRRVGAAKLTIDLLLISGLALCSGRGFQQIQAAFVLAPVMAAVRLDPRRTAAVSATSAILYVGIGLGHPASAPSPSATVLGHSLFVVWSGAAAVLMSGVRARRERRILALSEARGQLVAQTVDAEERARKQLSGLLHDNVIQDLLSARQDLAEAASGDRESFARATRALDAALSRLRGTIEDLDPYLLDHLELPAALEAIAARAAEHGDCRIEVVAETTAVGAQARLVASLARELIGNAARHAGAQRVQVGLRRERAMLVLEVRDDGRGFTPERSLAALRTGHIGLAASRERVEAAGGRFELDSRPRRGTRVRCLLPLSEPDQRRRGHRPAIMSGSPVVDLPPPDRVATVLAPASRRPGRAGGGRGRRDLASAAP